MGAVTGAAAGAVPSADVTVQMGPWAHGELKSLAELLDEVKDGDDRDERDDVTVGKETWETMRIVEQLQCKDSADLVKSGLDLAIWLSPVTNNTYIYCSW